VVIEAMGVLTEIDLNEIADTVLFALEAIDAEDCWNRSGRSRYGYTSPDEAAIGLIEGELRPFLDQIDRYQDLGMADQEAICCMGVMLECYRFEQEAKTEFREWSVDIPGDIVHLLLEKWQKRTRRRARINTMHVRSGALSAVGQAAKRLTALIWRRDKGRRSLLSMC
jgi:hypothetical protein